MAALFYIPISNVGGFQFLHILIKTFIVYPFDYGHPCWGSHFFAWYIKKNNSFVDYFPNLQEKSISNTINWTSDSGKGLIADIRVSERSDTQTLKEH